MAHKYSLLFNWKETRGWTETFYANDSGPINTNSVRDKAKNLAERRANVLSVGCRILACRVSDTAATNIVRQVEIDLPGMGGQFIVNQDTPDVVNLAALVNLYSASGARRSYLQRGLPDGDIVNGLLSFASTSRRRYDTYWNYLVDRFAIRDIVPGTWEPVLTIDEEGLVNTTNNITVEIGRTVEIHTTPSGGGPTIKVKRKITHVPSANFFYVKDWKWGTCAGGQIRDLAPEYSPISSWQLTQPAYVRTRQTGRPFGLLRGRQSPKY